MLINEGSRERWFSFRTYDESRAFQIRVYPLSILTKLFEHDNVFAVVINMKKLVNIKYRHKKYNRAIWPKPQIKETLDWYNKLFYRSDSE